MIKEISDLKSIELFSAHIIINNFSKTYGYYIDNNLVGFINFSIIYDRAELNYIFTNEHFRNKKIATNLINKMLSECMNLKNITLEVSIDNTKALNLYNKFGFIIVTKRDKYYNGKDAYLMMKEVN
ncbi:MAG: GNAT family N-acetyltransferase [Clostridium sp.]|nr:GNAT family N-acetyltransferase [Clostridium sp.]MCM1444186.1 GNAT family N-acetyltransferase [Candidatus Amulumruptor caecigallinarius]